MSDPELRIVLCTAPEAVAARLADEMLAGHLCACVNLVGPVESRYLWKGKLETAREVLMILKTRSDRLAALRAALLAGHPYEVPEILEVPVSGGHAAYLAWVADSARA